MRVLRKIAKWCFKLVPALSLLAIILLNFALYYSPSFNMMDESSYNVDVYHQLQFLKSELQQGAGDEMQSLFPEGFVFINALYGLTWTNLIQELNPNTLIYKEGMAEITWAIGQVSSPKAQQIFPKELPLEYGAFYKGWSNYLLGSKLAAQSEGDRDSIEVQLFKNNCRQISDALAQSETPFLQSYRGQTWPADITVGVASLSLHDKIFETEFQGSIEEWIGKVKRRLDRNTGLIPHSVEPVSGATIEGARGSSQSLMLNFLVEIDKEFAKEQFEIYKNLFLASRFGLHGIKEYPKGSRGRGDVDSGPVIFGIGGSASIVGQRTMGKFEEWEVYEGLRNSIEGFGAAYTWKGKKKYIFGQLPMADAFIAWSNSLEYKPYIVNSTSNWRLTFQLLSLLLIVLIVYVIRE